SQLVQRHLFQSGFHTLFDTPPRVLRKFTVEVTETTRHSALPPSPDSGQSAARHDTILPGRQFHASDGICHKRNDQTGGGMQVSASTRSGATTEPREPSHT